jgi:hypothetical protein
MGPSDKKAPEIPMSPKPATEFTKGMRPIEGFSDAMPQQ